MFFGRKIEGKNLADDFSQVQKGASKQVMIKGKRFVNCIL